MTLSKCVFQRNGILVMLFVVCFLFTACQGDGTRSLPTPLDATPAGPDASFSPAVSPQFTPVPTPNADQPLLGLRVFIDPGHQAQGDYTTEPNAPWGPEANATYNNTVMKRKCSSGTQGVVTRVEEYVVNLQIALALRSALTDLGAEVGMARETHDVQLSNKERAEMGNDFGADIVLRIHCNGTDSETAKGMELWVRDSGDGTEAYQERARRDRALAEELLPFLIAQTGAKNRGVRTSDSYTGINWSTVPCIILETGFMSNPEEDQLLCSEEYQGKIVQGIVNWFLETKQFS